MTMKQLHSDEVLPELSELVRVGLALSSEQDLATLLEMIVTTARSLTRADAGTLYIVDQAARTLEFKIMQNDTAKTNTNAVRNPDAPIPPPVQMYIDGAPNNGNASSYVGLTGETVNIADVYSAKGFNFTGVKSYDQVSGYHSKSMLVIPMRNHEGKIIGVLQLLNARATKSEEVISFTDLDAVMVSSLASQAAVALTNKNLLAQMKADLEEIQRLRNHEKELGDKLREAYIKTEQSNEELKNALSKVWMVRLAGLVFLLMMGAIGGASYWRGNDLNLFANLKTMVAARQLETTTASQAITIPLVKPDIRPVTSSVTLMGQVEPVKQINVVSPFSGKIAEVRFQYGQEVQAGDVLLAVDPSEVMVRLREAQGVMIRAEQNLKSLKAWETGPDVTRARMNQSRGKASLDSLKRKLDETKLMFGKGIIPKTELESAQEAYDNQLMNDRAAADEIKGLLERASRDNLRIAENEFKNANVRLNELQDQIDRASVKAPVSGVVLRPTSPEEERRGAGAKPMEKGVSVDQGQTLVVIGNLDGIAVRSQVDELNIGKVSIGQSARVSGDAFPELLLDGLITAVSCQAQGGGGARTEGGKPPSFDVTVTVPQLTAEQRVMLRVGMSASAMVTTYENPQAMVLPISAVMSEYDQHWVFRRHPGTGKFERTQIQAGTTTLDSVEVLGGITADDAVALSAESVTP